ncbi:kynureninase [Ferruginibacter yonginensis]|uniref:Kynureninase n=1 Tax=Ferruginibacter yonginensis TaxID=1310416 RepID=A0ABV8QQW7_9BACT
MQHEFSLDYAKHLDDKDALKQYRNKFYIPYVGDKEAIYFLGNSLGLQPKTAQDEVLNVMENWANFGVEGFFMGEDPWLNYHKTLSPILSDIVGALPHEIVTMNHLTVNLHLLMISFYRPTATRYKIICEAKAFPSDQYAFQSQVKLHGFNPADAIIEVHPKPGTHLITKDDILATIEAHKDSVALVLFSGVNYFTGQVFDIETITKAAHQAGAKAGFDLAHAAGNIALQLHQWNVDFACWCNYKYLNSGPGSIAGAYIHEKHLSDTNLQRLEGWWGNDEKNRFKMEPTFTPSPNAEAWQMSTAPMLLLATHKASLNIYKEVGFNNLVAKSQQLSSFMFYVLDTINTDGKYFKIITPTNPNERGCQVSIIVNADAKAVFDKLLPNGIFADWREPNVIRVAAVPMYNSFEDIYLFGITLHKLLAQ